MSDIDESGSMILKAGEIVRVGGIPVWLSSDVEVRTHPDNIALIEPGRIFTPVPSVHLRKAEKGDGAA